MNSEETLVMPASEPAHVRLVFTPDNMRNTTITLGHSSTTLYTVRSAKDYSSTEVVDARGEEVAKIKYNSVLSDSIRIRGLDKKLKDWIPDRKNFPVNMNASDGQKYIYKADSHLRVALYNAEDPDSPLAWYDAKSESHSAYLALTPAAEGIRDEVVCAYLMLRVALAASYATYRKGEGMGYIESRHPATVL